MPSKSEKQRRLFALAYLYKKKKLKNKKISKSLKEKLKKIVSKMSLKQIKDFMRIDD